MVRIKDYKYVRACKDCEFLGWFKSDPNGDYDCFGCVLTPSPNDMSNISKYGVRLVPNINKKPKWCRLKRF